MTNSESKEIMENTKVEPQQMKNIATFPKLIKFLVKYQWLNKGGNSKWAETARKLRMELQRNPETITYDIDVVTHQIKLHMPLEKNKRALIVLKIPRAVKFLCSAEQPPVRLAPTRTDVEKLSNCSGARQNACSSDEALTEFELEETVRLVQKWIKKKWYVPYNQNAIIVMDTSSDSEDSARATKIVVQRLQKHKNRKSTTSQKTRRPVIKGEQSDSLCNETPSDESEDSILL